MVLRAPWRISNSAPCACNLMRRGKPERVERSALDGMLRHAQLGPVERNFLPGSSSHSVAALRLPADMPSHPKGHTMERERHLARLAAERIRMDFDCPVPCMAFSEPAGRPWLRLKGNDDGSGSQLSERGNTLPAVCADIDDQSTFDQKILTPLYSGFANQSAARSLTPNERRQRREH